MTIEMKRVYLDIILERYHASNKKAKGLILDEFCYTAGYSRKYAIRLLNDPKHIIGKKRGPKPKYDATVVFHLKALWEAMGKICSKKMKAAIPLWLPFYKVDERNKNLLLEISPSTIDRLLSPYRGTRKGISSTQPGFLNSIPIKLLRSEIAEPGYMEVDTVAHCGDSLAGSFISSLTMTDLFSGWTENRASMSKRAEDIVEQIKDIELGLPFILKGYASDNGTEVLNKTVQKYLTDRSRPVDIVRGRPYKKNDQAHVEQKNYTHVRQLFRYNRYEEKDLCYLMNEIYRAFWNPLQNYFIPVLKLKSKERIGSKVKKKYDDPKTPFQRLIESEDISSSEKARLKEIIKTKNPFYLKKELDRRLKNFFRIAEMAKKQDMEAS